MERIIQKASELLKRCQAVTFATVNGEGFPRPVPVKTLRTDDALTIWFATGIDSEKVAHIRRNMRTGSLVLRSRRQRFPDRTRRGGDRSRDAARHVAAVVGGAFSRRAVRCELLSDQVYSGRGCVLPRRRIRQVPSGIGGRKGSGTGNDFSGEPFPAQSLIFAPESYAVSGRGRRDAVLSK